MSPQPKANLPEGGEVESTAVGLPRATNLSVCQDAIPPSLNILGRQLLHFKNPFVPSIMEATLPSNYKNLTIEKNDDTTDPNEHMDVYITQVSLYTTDDAILYQVFSTLLKG